MCPKETFGQPVNEENSNVKTLMRTKNGRKDGSELLYNNSNTSNPQEQREKGKDNTGSDEVHLHLLSSIKTERSPVKIPKHYLREQSIEDEDWSGDEESKKPDVLNKLFVDTGPSLKRRVT